MGKTSKPKPIEEEEKAKSNDSSDIFKILFGREACEEQGLFFDSNTINVDLKKKKREKSDFDAVLPESVDKDSKRKKKKKKKELNPNLDLVIDTNMPELINGEEENVKKKKKKRKEKEVKPDLVVANDEVKKRKKDNEKEISTHVVSIVEKSLERKGEGIGDLKEKKKKKKKRKRDEIEEAYEAKTYGVVANVEGKEKGDLGSRRVVGEKRKTVDNPAEMMVSKEGFDDESKLLRTIFVGNLPLKLKKKALLKEFSKFGEVESVRIRSVPLVDSKTPRKGAILKGKINESVDSFHAYIVFKDEKSAHASLSHNMAVVGGNHIRVDEACPPRKKLKGDNTPVYDNKRTVFVGNLPFDVKDEEIYQLFCGINQVASSIEAVRVIRDPNSSVGKGIAYVLFKTKEAANLVIKKRLKLRDRDLRLYHAKSDATPSKKRILSPSSADNSSGKRLAGTSSGSHPDKTKIKTNLSYQGLQASKSTQRKEGQKRDGFRPRTGEQGKQKPRTVISTEKKQRTTKRPAVAARKAKALKGVASPRQTGIKRKPERRTPESFQRNKKIRKLK